jgi:hypothetical protein
MRTHEAQECLAALGLANPSTCSLVTLARALITAMRQRPEAHVLHDLLMTVPPDMLSRALRKRLLPRVGYQEMSDKLGRVYQTMFGHIAAMAADAARRRIAAIKTKDEAKTKEDKLAHAVKKAHESATKLAQGYETLRAFNKARKLATNVAYDLRAVAAKDPYFQAYKALHYHMVSYLGNYLLNSGRAFLQEYTERTRYHAIAEVVVGSCLMTCGFLPPQGFIKPSERLGLAYRGDSPEIHVRTIHVELVAQWLMPALKEAMVILDLVPC